MDLSKSFEIVYIDDLMQERRNSIANALELRLLCINPSISFWCWASEKLLNQDWEVHDDIIKWKHIPRYWPFVRGIHRSPVNSPHKGQWRRALMFSLICVWINGWVNNHAPGDLRRYHAHYDLHCNVVPPTWCGGLATSSPLSRHDPASGISSGD